MSGQNYSVISAAGLQIVRLPEAQSRSRESPCQRGLVESHPGKNRMGGPTRPLGLTIEHFGEIMLDFLLSQLSPANS